MHASPSLASPFLSFNFHRTAPGLQLTALSSVQAGTESKESAGEGGKSRLVQKLSFAPLGCFRVEGNRGKKKRRDKERDPSFSRPLKSGQNAD